jgi:hypothetical protein
MSRFKYVIELDEKIRENRKYIPCSIYMLEYDPAIKKHELKETMGVLFGSMAGMDIYYVTRSNEEINDKPCLGKKCLIEKREMYRMETILIDSMAEDASTTTNVICGTSKNVIYRMIGTDPADIKEAWNKYWDNKIAELQDCKYQDAQY